MRFRTISLLLSLSQFLQSLRRSSLSFSSFASPCSLVGGRCQREETGRGRRHDVGASLHLLSESRLGRLGGKHSCLASRHKLPALLLFDFWTYDGPEKEPSLHLQKIQRGKCSSSHSCAVWGTSLKQDEKGFQQQENSRSRLSREPLSSRSTCFRWICTLRRQYRGIRCFARSAQTAVPRRQKRKILTVGPLGRLPSAYCRCPSSSHLGEIGGGMFETKVRERGPAEHSTLSTATEDDVNTECFRTGQFLWRDWRCFPFSKMMDRRRTSRQRMKKRRRRGRRGGTQEAPSELRGSCGYGIQHFLLSDVVLAHSSQSSVVRPRDGVSTLLRCTATQNDQCLYTPLRDEALLSCLLSMSPKTGCSTARRCFSGSSSSFLVSPSSRNRIGDLHTRRGRLRRSLYGSRERPLPTLAGTRISPCSTSYSPLGASLHKQQSSFPSSSLSAFSSSSSSVSLPRLCIFFPRGSLPLIGDGTSPTEGRRPSPPAGSNASPERAHVPPSGLASAVEGLTESKSFVNQGNGSVEGDLLLQCLPCASPASLPKNLKQLMQNNHGGSHDAPEAFFYPGRQMPFLFFLHSFPRPSGHHRGKGDRESPSAKENKNLTTEEETLKTPHFCRNAESAAEVSACQLPPPLGLPIVYTSFLLPPSFPRDHPLQPQKLARLFAELMKDVPRERQPSANQAQDDASHSGGKETADSESCRRKLPSSGGVFGQHLVGHKETMGRRDSRRKEKLDKEEEQVDRETNEASEGALSVSRKPLRGHRSVWRGDGAVDSTTPGDAAAAWLGGEEARKHFSLQNNGGGEGELMMSKGSANLQSSPVPSTEKVELQQEESEKGEEGRNQDKNEIGNCAGRGGERERFSSIRKPNNKQWEPNLYPGNSDTSLFSPVLDEDIICSWLRSVHTPEYVTAAASATLEEREQRKVGLPVTRGYVRKSLAEVSCTVLASWLAVQFGVACVVGGGTHHAKAAEGGKFCLFNDVATAARMALLRKAAERVLILDLDVHQGDGTAEIFKDDPNIITVSVHCEDNFPFPKAKSDVDVGLPSGFGDDEYLNVLNKLLPAVLLKFRPSLLFYVAGVDVHSEDKLGNLLLSDDGLRRREDLVFRHCLEYNRQRLHAGQREAQPQTTPSHSLPAKGACPARQGVRALLNDEWIDWQANDQIDEALTCLLQRSSTVAGCKEIIPAKSDRVRLPPPPVGVCCVVAGGYSVDVENTVKRHMYLFNTAKHFWFNERYGSFYLPPQHLCPTSGMTNLPDSKRPGSF